MLSWAPVELLDDGTVLRKEYETEAEAQAVLWKMLDDAPNQEERDRLSGQLATSRAAPPSKTAERNATLRPGPRSSVDRAAVYEIAAAV